MGELGDKSWWRTKRWGRTADAGKAPRRLASTLHTAYHALVISEQEGVFWQMTFRDGRLRDLFVSRLEMERAVKGAKAWCLNNFRNGEYGRALDAVGHRLPEDWAKSLTRCCFALKAFETLCEGRAKDPYGELESLSRRLHRSPASLRLDRLDFFLFVGAIALDEDAWESAMTGLDRWTDAAGQVHEEQATEPEEVSGEQLSPAAPGPPPGRQS